MTVRELIEQLERVNDPDLPVSIRFEYDCGYAREEAPIVRIYSDKVDPYDNDPVDGVAIYASTMWWTYKDEWYEEA